MNFVMTTYTHTLLKKMMQREPNKNGEEEEEEEEDKFGIISRQNENGQKTQLISS